MEGEDIISDILLRRAAPEDAGEYTACHIACWQSAYRGIVPDEYLDGMNAELEERTEKRRQYIIDPDREDYCVMLDDKMIGFLVYGKGRDEDKADSGEVCGIYLRGEYWDRGYGSRMMKFAIEGLKRAGYREAFLWVLEENARAKKFYEKHGFAPDGASKTIELGKPLIELRYMRSI